MNWKVKILLSCKIVFIIIGIFLGFVSLRIESFDFWSFCEAVGMNIFFTFIYIIFFPYNRQRVSFTQIATLIYFLISLAVGTTVKIIIFEDIFSFNFGFLLLQNIYILFIIFLISIFVEHEVMREVKTV